MKAQKDGRVFETCKIEFKRNYYDLHKKAVKAELVVDVSSLANAPSDPEEDTGLLILGVTPDAQIIPDYKMAVTDTADFHDIINQRLERPVHFFYEPLEFDGYKFAALVIPKSPHRPHLVKEDFRDDNKDLLLHKGDGWTRTGVGGKKKMLSPDYDLIYEDYTRKRVDEATAAQAKLLAAQSAFQNESNNPKPTPSILTLSPEDLNRYSGPLLRRL